MQTKYLKIGQLAEASGVTADTLRYYEKHGLLRPSARSASGYRLYSSADAARIDFIVSAKEVGFTLREIKELLALEVTRDEHSCAQVKTFVDEKISVVGKRMAELKRMQKSLQALSDACCGGSEPATHCTILDTLADRETKR